MTSIAPPSSKKQAREVGVPSSLSQQKLCFQHQFHQPNMVVYSSATPMNHAISNQNRQEQQPNMVVCTPANTQFVNSVPPCASPAQSRLHGSARASTTGRDGVSLPYHQSEDIDSIVRLHTEQMRLGLAGAMKKQGTALLAAAQQQVANRLREKEIEIMKINQRNAELEQKAMRLAVESQTWLNVAKNKEAVACSLRATIQQFVDAGVAPAEEGFGERELHPAADDASSCCFGEDEKVRRWNRCWSCGEGEVCVLLLPCRHLCLCKDCETRIEACPVCNSVRKACLRVLMP